MKKALRVFLIMYGFFAGLSVFAQTSVPFEFYEDFDDPTHYEEGGSLPDGWAASGSVFALVRATGSDYGVMPKSGSYVLATIGSTSSGIDEVIYTPMMKMAEGEPCSIKFYIYAPGGTPSSVRSYAVSVKAGSGQSMEAQVYDVANKDRQAYTEWTEVIGTFTPEADGEYCFSIQFSSMIASCGVLAIDDVLINGKAPADVTPIPELEPDPENEGEALMPPYSESFDNENENYDGTTNVPALWLTTGTKPFMTANMTELPAKTGTYYIITPDAIELRDERLYTPFFMLEEGREYVMSVYVHMDEGLAGGNTTLDITVGTQQESDFHVSLLTLENYCNEGWERKEVRFTPKVAGAYCFSFAISSTTSYAGYVAFDDFMITSEGLISKPRAAFGCSHLYDITTSDMLVYAGQSVKMVNLSSDASEYEWSVIDNDNVKISDVMAEEPEIEFLESGKYTVKLIARNSVGEHSTFREFNVEYVKRDKDNYGITTAAGDDTYYSRALLPAFDTSETDFITGPNHYYRKIAERFCFPEGVEVSFNSLNLVKTNIHYKAKDNSREEQFNVKFDVVIYGETDGKLDETKVYGRYSSTLAETFGTTGIGAGYGDFMSISFETPVTVKGICYLAFIYGDDVDLEIDDPNVGCTYVGLSAVKHSSGVTTLMVKPHALPETSSAALDEWCYVDQIEPELMGFGLWMTVWIDSKTDPVVSVALNSFGETVFDIRSVDGGFIVSGTEAGETVYVYGASGAVVSSAVAHGESTFVPVGDIAGGLYVIKANAGVKKVIR